MADGSNRENLAYSQIKEAIIRGVYPPGYQIVEETVAAQLGISRSPVHAALRQLQAEGFVEKRSNRSLYVAFGNSRKTIDALYIRRALEGTAAALAAGSRTEEDVLRLRSLLDLLKTSAEKDDSFEALGQGINIHRVIYEIAGNEQLKRLGTTVLEQEAIFSYRSLSKDSRDRMNDSYQEHAAIIKAIEDRCPEEAEKLAREHIDKLIARVARFDTDKTVQGVLLTP